MTAAPNFKFVWKRAFDAAALPNGYTARAIVLAGRLSDHCNTRTGQCNPREDVLAKEMGCSDTTVKRARRELKDYGWIKTKRGGSDDPLNYTLVIPATMVAGMDHVTTAPSLPRDTGSYRPDSASIPATQCGPSNEQGTRIGPRPSAAPTVRVDRVDVTDADDPYVAAAGNHSPTNARADARVQPERKVTMSVVMLDFWADLEIAFSLVKDGTPESNRMMMSEFLDDYRDAWLKIAADCKANPDLQERLDEALAISGY